MVTSSNPYFRKIGLNISNHFLYSVCKSNSNYLNIFFKRNEREALGRRILIAIYILEKYKIDRIVESVKCGRQTINDIKKDIEANSSDTKKLLEDLREIYYSQFSKKVFHASPKTLLGSKRTLGIIKTVNPRHTKVKLP